MFEQLSERINSVLRKLKGQGRLNEKNIKEALREIRLALLEADVNYKVAKEFIKRVRERALGQDVIESLTPGQQVVKIVHEELTTLMGGTHKELNLSGKPPHSIMFVGLQGSGKTTTVAKLGLYLKKQHRRPLLVPADTQRPAAIEQLTRLGKSIDILTFPSSADMSPVEIAKKAYGFAKEEGADVILVDTAGRLHVDDELMKELSALKEILRPKEIFLVADAMTGQEAVNIAETFNNYLSLTGVVLTKMEGDARGGAALSIMATINCPIKFIGVGEKLDAIEVFHPDRMASRILDMGDVLSLIEKAQEAFDEKQARELEKKLREDSFTLEDFLVQLQQIKKMGSLENILSMLPGMGKLKKLKNLQPSEKELVRIEAIINSMTKEERRNHHIINASRKRRIAKGSGTSVQQVNQLLKNFAQTQKMIKKLTSGGRKGMMRGLFPF